MKNLEDIIRGENEYWTRVFQSELDRGETAEKFSSYWWEEYYRDIVEFVNGVLRTARLSTVLEAGSGSGKATILLDEALQKTLLDISPVALEYAAFLAKRFSSSRVACMEGDIFQMPFQEGAFDFVWNIGVVEHYDLEDAGRIVEEMIRVCRRGGAIAIGVPNSRSGPIMKAWLLKWLRVFPGYKLTTERFYGAYAMERLVRDAAARLGRRIEWMEVEYIGNPLFMETPAFLLKSVGTFVSRRYVDRRFLILIVCKFEAYA